MKPYYQDDAVTIYHGSLLPVVCARCHLSWTHEHEECWAVVVKGPVDEYDYWSTLTESQKQRRLINWK